MGPTPPVTSASSTVVPTGTLNPAFSAIQTGDWPTTLAFNLAPAQFSAPADAPKMNSSNFVFSSGVHT